jgi:hypothetical protein
MVYSLATEKKEAPRGPEDSTQRDVARAVRCVSLAVGGGFGPTGRTAHRQSGRGLVKKADCERPCLSYTPCRVRLKTKLGCSPRDLRKAETTVRTGPEGWGE